LRLVAWKVLEVDWRQKAFRKELPLSSQLLEGEVLTHITSRPGESGWCSGSQIDPFHCHLNCILDFLLHSFEEGLEYSAIAGYRSIISAYHDPIDNIPAGKHERVSTLMVGIHNEPPISNLGTTSFGMQKW